MSLKIKTFSNVTGGSSFFKALGHPVTAEKMPALLAKLAAHRAVAFYDPLGHAEDVASFYDFSKVAVGHLFVQNIEQAGTEILGLKARPVTEIGASGVDAVFIAAFDSTRLHDHVRHLMPAGAAVYSLDDVRLPDEMLTNKRAYLDNLNFATNKAFFREADGLHTRIATANYWAGYGARGARIWCRLSDENGRELKTWTETLGDTVHPIAIDSKQVAARFGLASFTGSLFLHVIGGGGHDVVKYALDIYGDSDDVLSCTHDANAWPADFYAGLPAPRAGEKVILWVENSHPCPIPAGAVGLNLMGDAKIAWHQEEIPPFGVRALDVSKLLPNAVWPQQIEVQAGRHFVRPRYEVIAANGRRRIAHANVERTDLKPDAGIPGLKTLMGKGFILPAPVLPVDRFRSIVLPTPMSTCQEDIPAALTVYDREGKDIAREFLGRLPRNAIGAYDATAMVERAGAALPGGYGHMELTYDFSQGGSADSWLHGLFRYEDEKTGHGAETSFGAHIFNTALVYKNQPQSYVGRPPGLSTRLFLRLGSEEGLDAQCHLIYPASTPWHARSSTDLILCDGTGAEVAKTTVAIACGGSLLWRYSEMFDAETRARAGLSAYVLIRDTTCRLFGYHGLVREGKAFSLDHMFGF